MDIGDTQIANHGNYLDIDTDLGAFNFNSGYAIFNNDNTGVDSLEVNGTGDGGGAGVCQMSWFDSVTKKKLGCMSDLGSGGYDGAFYLLGDSLNAPFGEMANFFALDRELQPGDARIGGFSNRLDGAGGFRMDFVVKNSGGGLVLPFGVTPTGIIIGTNIDGVEPSAQLNLEAGTGSAGQAPLKIGAGSLMATPERGAFEYDFISNRLMFSPSTTQRDRFAFTTSTQVWTSSQTFTTISASSATIQISSNSIARVGGVVFDVYVDSGNNGTIETDLYRNNIASGSWINNGDKITFRYSGTALNSATATTDIKVYIGTTSVFDSTALAMTSAASWDTQGMFLRDSASTVRVVTAFSASGLALSSSDNYTTVGGLNFNGNILIKVTGTRAGVGAASNDILAKIGTSSYAPRGN